MAKGRERHSRRFLGSVRPWRGGVGESAQRSLPGGPHAGLVGQASVGLQLDGSGLVLKRRAEMLIRIVPCREDLLREACSQPGAGAHEVCAFLEGWGAESTSPGVSKQDAPERVRTASVPLLPEQPRPRPAPPGSLALRNLEPGGGRRPARATGRPSHPVCKYF